MLIFLQRALTVNITQYPYHQRGRTEKVRTLSCKQCRITGREKKRTTFLCTTVLYYGKERKRGEYSSHTATAVWYYGKGKRKENTTAAHGCRVIVAARHKSRLNRGNR